MTVYAVNGLGRIGKLILKPLLERGAQIAWINDAVGDAEMHAHLLEFDTVHGRWDAVFAHDADSVTIDGTRLPFIGTRDLSALPLEGVDVVIDCTGVFKTEAKLAPYFDAGVKKVVVSAPVKDGDAANIVYGVNHDIYECQRRSKIQPQGGAKTGHFGFGRNARHEAAASQPRFPNSWRLTGRFGPSGPNLDRLDQALLLDLRARL
ncbi:Glyceraldehyde-3-phosphate dehydrogenase 3 [Roseovarius tolerans]|uniref:Glyceraldehyde-3-phosphate dehydrogenase 3 n=1 Tax=Roseovarius tolerans TaxID=74031 RepID=A0A0L6CTY3_9RHOB|nr:Glyceraldehyde-3-phosphate dehydrogenase 3 [Roseovarius tolerans]